MKYYLVYFWERSFIVTVSDENLLGRYDAYGNYFFAAFTRSIDATRYAQRENELIRAR